MNASRTRRSLLAGLALVAAAAFGLAAAQSADAPKTQPAKDRLLVFSKTAGFRHASIPDGVKALQELFKDRYEVEATEDAAQFTDENLKRFKAVIFLSTTGDILNADQQKAFEGFIKAGGGYAGVHAAADCEYSWPWYGQLVGAYFKTHPNIQATTLKVEDRTHRSTRMLPAEWRRTDEWYVYDKSPRDRVKILASIDDSTIQGATMGADHPIAWYHDFDGGRAWFFNGTATTESFREELFLKHLEGGILWAAGAADTAPGAAKPTDKPRQ